MAQPFAPVPRKSFPAVELRTTTDARFWKSYKLCGEIGQPATVTDLSFCPVTGNKLLSTAGSQISFISAQSGQILSRLAVFKEHTYGGSFRKDGALIVAGGEEAVVQIFDASRKNILRKFVGHKGAVHSTKFSNDGLHVLSGGDDHAVRCWDLPTESCLMELSSHKDFVRAQSACPSPHLWATGSYDKRLRLFDLRSGEVVFNLNHQSPVEDVVVFPSGVLVVSVGGNEIKIWDLLSGGSLLASLRNHARSAMCATINSSGTRLLTAGLDQQLKVYNTSSFEMVASLWFDGEIVSIALARDDRSLACGLSNGKVVLKRRPAESSSSKSIHAKHFLSLKKKEEPRGPLPGTIRYFFRGQKAHPEDIIISKASKIKLKTHDKMLQSFRYRDALDAVMETGQTALTCAVLEELVSRNGLEIALSGRNKESLRPIFQLLVKNIQNPYYSHTLIGLAKLLLNIYEQILMASPEMRPALEKLLSCVKEELQIQQEMKRLMGQTKSILANCEKVLDR
eukprot:jgi/Galph1/5983/GphlegSOOS_G4604.1